MNLALLDELTSDGIKTGRLITHDDAHQNGVWHETIHVWILDSSGRTLLQKRSLEKVNFPGLWDAACAGHVESGEPPIIAACRELDEELGIKILPSELKPFGKLCRETLHNINYHDREWQHLFALHISEDTNLTLGLDEVAEAKWFHIKEIAFMLTEQKHTITPMEPEFKAFLRYTGNLD